MTKNKTIYVLYLGPFDPRVPRWLWVITPLPGHTLGGD